MKRRFALILMTLSLASASQASPLDPLSFLLGSWKATGGGSSGQGTGTTSFQESLQQRVIVRTNMAEYPAAGDKPASRHDDLMIIYPEGKDLRADYYDSEGHVIRYQVATTTDHSAVLTSDVVSGAPRYRLSYSLTPTKELEGKFEIAPPGKSEEFRQYLSWTSRRVPAEG